MPYASASQRRLMEGIAHGWHPTHMKHAPSKAVAQEFHRADKAERKRKAMARALKG